MTRLPDFIVAGVRKCGTTWLHQCLSEHPDIFVPPMVKELFFFDRHWSRGGEWYAKHFARARPEQICGEATPTYFVRPDVPERIHRTVPRVKLIFIFRDPVARAVSMYHHMRAVGETHLSFADAITDVPDIVDDGLYAKNYARFVERFGSEALLPLVLEEVRADRTGWKTIFSFLGADSGFVPPSHETRTYERRESRHAALGSFVGKTTMALRDSGLHGIVNAAKSLGLANLFYRDKPSGNNDTISAADTERLRDRFRTDTEHFGRMIGKDLSRFWRGVGAERGAIR